MVERDGQTSHLSHDRLVEIAKSAVLCDADATAEEVANIVSELLWRRAEMRKDSRRAKEIKKLRWIAENMVSKIERLEKVDVDAEVVDG